MRVGHYITREPTWKGVEKGILNFTLVYHGDEPIDVFLCGTYSYAKEEFYGQEETISVEKTVGLAGIYLNYIVELSDIEENK